MKNGLSLQEMAAELARRSLAKQDFVADTRSMALNDSSELIIGKKKETLNPDPFVAADAQFIAEKGKPLNAIAHQQITSRLDIPVKYYNRMLEKTPELLARNVNHWFASSPEKRLVRTLDGTVRAFLSDRYQRIENEQIANVVLPILLEEPEVRIESCQITDSRMYIKAVFPRIQGEVSKGDIVQSGIAISNSEVGQGAVKIEPLVFRLVCLNGMIINDSKFSARHVGGRIGSNDSNIITMLSDEAIKADDHAILLKTRDVVRAAFDSVRFNEHLTKMRGATEDKLSGNPAEAVKVLAKKQALNEFEEGSILRHLIAGGDVSRWGLLNAVTRTAQDVESYDRATELETLGGNILNLPRNQWQEIAVAA